MNKNVTAAAIHVSVVTVGILGAIVINELGGGWSLAFLFIVLIGVVDFAVSTMVLKKNGPPT
jgi:hypothetical protein